MASANLAVILSVVISLLLLLSAAARLPNIAADESTAVALPLDAPKDAEPTELLIPLVDKTKVDLPILVDGFAHVDRSLVRPFHRHHPHCHHGHHGHLDHHGHRLWGREVVHYGDDMISAPKHGEWSSFFNAATDVVVPEEINRRMVNKEDEKDGGWRIRKKEHKKKRRTEDEDSDSDSDSDDEGIETGKKEIRKRKKEKGGWLKWFWGLWD